MNYKKIYDQLIQKRQIYPLTKTDQNSSQIETHHILMKSLGGTNDKSNLVNLTVREHLFAHLLLTYIYKGQPGEKEACAAWVQMTYENPFKATKFLQKKRIEAHEKSSKLISESLTGMLWVNNGMESHFVRPNEIPEGYERGRLMTSALVKHNQTVCKDLIHITDGNITMRIKAGDPIPEGFHYGRKGAAYKKHRKEFVEDAQRIYDKFIELGLSYERLKDEMPELKDRFSDNKYVCQLFSRYIPGFDYDELLQKVISAGTFQSDYMYLIEKGIRPAESDYIMVTDGKHSKRVLWNSIPEGWVPGHVSRGILRLK